MSVPKPCKYCSALTHYSFQCYLAPRKPPKPRKAIRKKGKATIKYELWRDTVAIPYLNETFGRVCAACGGERCNNLQLDVDHIQNRGSHSELKMTLSNVQYLGRYPCHYEKTINRA